MADFRFWQDLAEEFRAVPEDNALVYKVIDGMPGTVPPPDNRWYAFSNTLHIAQKFELLARRGGAELSTDPAVDSFNGWMEALNVYGVNAHTETQTFPNQSERVIQVKRVIRHPAEASALFCGGEAIRAVERARGNKAKDAADRLTQESASGRDENKKAKSTTTITSPRDVDDGPSETDKQELERAMRVLEKHPQFAAAQVKYIRLTRRLKRDIPIGDLPPIPSPARMKYALRFIDILAKSYLVLVADLEFQKAFAAMLRLHAKGALRLYGCGVEFFAGSPMVAPIEQRLLHWQEKGYREIAPKKQSASTKIDNISSCERTTLVAEFLVASNVISSTHLFKRHIWRAAGHTQARQFEYWQSRSSRTNTSDEQTFARIMSMTPREFVKLLIDRNIIPAHSLSD